MVRGEGGGQQQVWLVWEAKDPNPKKNIEPEHYSKPQATAKQSLSLSLSLWTQEGDFLGRSIQGALFMGGETKG